MRVSDWAKKEGIHYQTAWKWWKQGTLPVPARQTPTGTSLVDEPRGRSARRRAERALGAAGAAA